MNKIKHASVITAYRGVALSALTAILAAGCAPVDETDAHTSQPAVFGTDDRQDVYAHTDGWMKAIARQSTVAIMTSSSVNTTNANNVTFTSPTLGARYNLCATERFRNDPTAAECTGTLIDDDLVLTSGGCVQDAAQCADTRIVFNYYRDSTSALHTVTTSDVFRCASLVARRAGWVGGRWLQYSIVRLDRPAAPRFTPVPMRRSPPTLVDGQRLGSVANGLGLPAKVDTGVTVRDAHALTRDWFLANVDVFSSGAGLWDLNNYEFAGIVDGFYTHNILSGATCNTINACAETGCTGEGSTYLRNILDDYCATNTNPRLCSPPAAPVNDDHARAIRLTLGAGETTVTGTTSGATRDGPAVPCNNTSGGNVWYSFVLLQPEVVYLDTAGSNTDTSVFITDSRGNPVAGQPGNPNAGLCNDNAGCTTGGFQWAAESRTAGVLGVGTYFVSVSAGYSHNFTLHLQHMPVRAGSYFYAPQLSGDGTARTFLTGTSAASSATCGGTGSGEDVRWFVSCGAQPQLFSVCQGDGGAFTRQSGSNTYDPVMYLRSAQTGADVTCNDDGPSTSNCVGTGGDTRPFGSRLASVTVPRGLNALFVDSRTGGPGMAYTLRYTVR